jgi:RNA polymerase-binding transcription factor DksA
MQVYKLVMRRCILAHLVEELKSSADLEFPGGTRAFDRISTYEIGALLYARNDPGVAGLRRALERLENGTFGLCRRCKARIGWSLLLGDPRRAVCLECERQDGSLRGMERPLSADVKGGDALPAVPR